MANKFKDIRHKWLDEKGFNVLADDLQREYVDSLFAPVDEVQAVFCEAKAGTGKTVLATLAGVYEVEAGHYDRIIYVRNAIPIREQGFLPGDLQNGKELPYMKPLISAMDKVQPGLFTFWSTAQPKEQKVITTTTSYIRGDDWSNSWVILDESQSFDLEELQTVYTRCNDSCKIVTIGSLRQNDNRKQRKYAGHTPLEVYMEHFKHMPNEDREIRYHTLETVYRGAFADYADDVQDTVDRLNKE